MGGAISYLLTIDVLAGNAPVREGCRLKVVSFGSPRAGDDSLVKHWRASVTSYRNAHGQDSLIELCVKGFNDGAPNL